MLNSFSVSVIVGTILGFLSGLGVGGGSLLILWLTLVLELPPETARGINLAFFLPAAIAASIFRLRQGCIPFKKIMPAILSGSISASIFSFWGTTMNISLLKKCFGGLLLITGLRELFYRPQKTQREGI